ncbi:ABC transporter permease [Dactylosporangium siamense]|uniref:Peptide ABC transporter permease n=1 Tax=Dactylosporangium siamense TaxID=685454 RepID=A0A919UDK4_9ACTN|nr:ABC transporter permease [Dactylosporangium siamense]GIG48011.1 peptide ABC transporter permease [Dactylosporangium siamense]
MHLVRKLAQYLVALWVALTLNFALPRLLPGDPVDAVLSKLQQQGPVDPESRHALEVLFGNTGGPWWQQYLDYLAGIAHGDLGTSVTYFPTPVTTVISESLPWTLVLVGMVTVLTFVLGTALGTIAGWRRGTWIDSLVPATTVLQSIPYFWVALIFLYVFGVTLGWFPLGGGYDSNEFVPELSFAFIGSAAYYAILPALTILVSAIGGWLLGMRNMMVAVRSEDYVVAAEAKGLRPLRVMTMYAARNAVLPSVAGFAISLGFVVGGSLVMEQVFSYPGIGRAMLQAVSNSDYALMQGLFLVITVSVLAANLVVDVLYGLIDPRTRVHA